MLLPTGTQPSEHLVFVISFHVVMLLPQGVHVRGKCTVFLKQPLSFNEFKELRVNWVSKILNCLCFKCISETIYYFLCMVCAKDIFAPEAVYLCVFVSVLVHLCY